MQQTAVPACLLHRFPLLAEREASLVEYEILLLVKAVDPTLGIPNDHLSDHQDQLAYALFCIAELRGYVLLNNVIALPTNEVFEVYGP